MSYSSPSLVLFDAGRLRQLERERNDHCDQRKGRERYATELPAAGLRAHDGRGAGRPVPDHAGCFPFHLPNSGDGDGLVAG